MKYNICTCWFYCWLESCMCYPLLSYNSFIKCSSKIYHLHTPYSMLMHHTNPNLLTLPWVLQVPVLLKSHWPTLHSAATSLHFSSLQPVNLYNLYVLSEMFFLKNSPLIIYISCQNSPLILYISCQSCKHFKSSILLRISSDFCI